MQLWVMLTGMAFWCSYLLITISTGTEPTNKLWYVEMANLPKKPSGSLDLSSYDLK